MTTISVTSKQYIEQRENYYFIKESRVSLDSIVINFLNGVSPEGIAQSFPALTLEQVYGAIAFYLANRQAIDTYLQESKAAYEKLRDMERQNNREFYGKLIAAKSQNL